MPVTIELPPDLLVKDLQNQAMREGVPLAHLLSELLSKRQSLVAAGQSVNGHVELPLVWPRYPDPLHPITGQDLDESSAHDDLSS